MRTRPFCSFINALFASNTDKRLFMLSDSAKYPGVGSLSEAEWKLHRERHEDRFEKLVAPHARRRNRHEKDPVVDFLFEYYSFRPAHLKKWSPGFGVTLCGTDSAQLLNHEHYEACDLGVRLTLSNAPEHFERGTRWILELLQSTKNRTAQFGCFGMHEWAMLYKTERARHPQLQLRVSQEALNEVVEAGPVNCSHYDAFRFFTPEARPLNNRQLGREDMTNCEQPGCLHANMDMYRWAFKRYPWVDSDLIMDAFELAMEIRILDMAASPYDVTEFGIEPVAVESDDGRQHYIIEQKQFAERASALRERLIVAYQNMLLGHEALHGSFANSGSNS